MKKVLIVIYALTVMMTAFAKDYETVKVDGVGKVKVYENFKTVEEHYDFTKDVNLLQIKLSKKYGNAYVYPTMVELNFDACDAYASLLFDYCISNVKSGASHQWNLKSTKNNVAVDLGIQLVICKEHDTLHLIESVVIKESAKSKVGRALNATTKGMKDISDRLEKRHEENSWHNIMRKQKLYQ